MNDLISFIEQAISEVISPQLCNAIFRLPEGSKFEERNRAGVTLYTRPKNLHQTSHLTQHLNRRLETQRVMTHTRK